MVIPWTLSHCLVTREQWISLHLLLFTLSSLLTSANPAGSQSQNHFHAMQGQNPVAVTKYGPIKGVKMQFSTTTTRHLDPVAAFLGIPYASPPINAYRFMPPVAPLPWRETRSATSLPPACPQRFPDISNKTKALQTMTEQRYLFLMRLIPHLAHQSEDCLYLNFFVPTSSLSGDGRLPILLVIHGESWEWGSGSEFDGAALASLGNHIVVTFNYRLGPLGFLKTSNQQSNFGLLDVIAALHWVKENADSFGGDRNRISLLGYKTGAVVANLLLVAQIAKGLFQRAVLISGSVLSPWALQRRPEDIAKQLSVHLGCVGKLPLSHPESDLAPCLRKKHVSDILNFVPDSPKFLSPYAPYVDNILLNNPKTVMEGQPSDQFLRAEILLVFTTSEGVHELNDHELKNGFESDHRDKILRTLVRNVFNYHQQEIFSIVRNEYTDWERPILHPIPLRDSTVEALSDCVTIGPALQVAMIHAKRGAKTFVMHFSHVSRDNEFSTHERLGSCEGDIVPYLMGLPVTNNTRVLGGPTTVSPFSFISNFTKQDPLVAETLVHYISNFVKSGDPNANEPSALGLSSSTQGDSSAMSLNDDWVIGGGSNSREQRLLRARSLHWDPYEPISQSYMSLGAKPKMKSHYRGHKMGIWLNLIPQIHLPGGTDVTLSHHAFPDDNPNLYIGPVRPLSAYSVGDQVPGFGIIVRDGSFGPQTASPGTSLTTTECLESTDSPLSQGTRHSVLRIDSNEVEVEIRGNGGTGIGDHVIPLSSSPNAGFGSGSGNGTDYDYTTALTVTITVGVCLILLNLVVFSAIMCHRKRGIPISHNQGGSGGGSDTASGRSSPAGTPQKGPYQEDYKWPTSCCSSGMNPNDFPTTHLSYHGHGGGGGESISMNQYHHPTACDHPMKMNMNLSGTLPRSAPHPHFCETSGGGTLKRHHQLQHGHQGLSLPPDCVQNLLPPECSGFNTGNNQFDIGPPNSSIRLYMNQGAGDNILDIPPPDPPRSSVAMLRASGGNPAAPPPPIVPSSTSPSATNTNTTNSTSSNPSPNSGSTTLVGVLKRHSSSSTPSSTVKKRVQIQEISV